MARGGFDYSQYRNWRNNFSKFSQGFYKWLEQFLYQQGLKFIATVKPLTPVDTGDLRNHWQLEDIVIQGTDVQCWFINPMEYATFVEYGHAKPYQSGATPGSEDWVDGFFMMTVALEEVERELPQEFDAAFEAFINGMGV